MMQTTPTHTRFKLPFNLLASALVWSSLAIFSDAARAADVVKADNLDNLDLGSSWTNGAPPTAADVAVWDATVATAVPHTVSLGADANWGGIRILGPGSPVTISAGNTLTLGGSGVDTSGGSQSLTLAGPVTIGTGQNWNLVPAVTVSGVISGAAGNGITLTGPGQLTVGGVNNSFLEGITVSLGTVNVTASSSMPVRLNGGTLSLGTSTHSNPVEVKAGGGSLNVPSNRTVSGAFTGSGTVTAIITSSGRVLSFDGNVFSGFTGTFSMGTSIGRLRPNNSAFAGSDAMTLDLGSATGFFDPNGSSAIAPRVHFGALRGAVGTDFVGDGAVYVIGGLNTDHTFSGELKNCSIVKIGTGTWTLDGANTHAGGTTISNGVLQVGFFGSSGDLGSGGVTNHAALTFNRFDTFTIPNAISGSGAVSNIGSGRVVLTGVNNYSGPTVVVSGGLVFGSASAVTGNITVAGGATLGAVVTTSGATSSQGSATFASGSTYEFDLGTLGNPVAPLVTNTGTITLSGNVTVNVMGDAAFLSPGTNTLVTYSARSGAGSFVAGTLPTDVNGTIIDDTANKRLLLAINSVNFVDPTLRYVGDSAGVWDSDNTANQIWKVVGTGQTTNFYFNAAALLDDSATGTTSLNISTFVTAESVTVSNVTKAYTFGGTGSISGSGGLTKRGAGTLVITNANSYTGLTAIEDGSIRIAGETGAIGNGGVTNNGALIIDKTSATNVVPHTFMFFGQITGTGSLTLLGADKSNSIVEVEVGTEHGNPYSGGTTISNAHVRLNANPSGDATRSAAKSTGLGTGMITLLGDSILELEDFGVGNGSAQAGTFAAPLSVPAGQAAEFRTPGRYELTSPLTGSGTLNLVVSFLRGNVSGDWSAFSGQINVSTADGDDDFRVATAAGFPAARLHLAPGVNMYSRASGGSVIPVGELSGQAGAEIDADLSGAAESGGTVTWRVGGLNTTATFAGSFLEGAVDDTISLIKEGTGTWTLSGTNAYRGTTTVSNGVLALVGASADPVSSTGLRVLAPGVLDASGLPGGTVSLNTTNNLSVGGDGTIRGSLVVGSSSPAVSVEPGASIGTLSVTNALSLSANTIITMEVATGNNSDRIVAASFNMSGASVVVTNVGGSALQAGDTFQLFSQGVSGLGAVNLPASDAFANYTWNNNLAANGTVSVASVIPAVNPTPTNITFSASGGNLNLSWPASHLGWILQAQTNSRSVGINSNWFDIPGSVSVTTTNFPLNPADPTVFYRLRLP